MATQVGEGAAVPQVPHRRHLRCALLDSPSACSEVHVLVLVCSTLPGRGAAHRRLLLNENARRRARA